MSIRFWNRRKQKMEAEKVFGDGFIKTLYGNPLGRFFTDKFLVNKFVSDVYGGMQDSPSSAKKIPRFVKKFQIPMDDYEPGPFASFNKFFIRRFKEGKRSFPKDAQAMGAPAEARYFGFARLTDSTLLPVKGMQLRSEQVLGTSSDTLSFQEGPCLLARLCPVDYHRFHFPDNGKVLSTWRAEGTLHSVNPLALKARPELLAENERQITILETEHFGKLAYVEVGALCVGKIVQSHRKTEFRRGEEKGYFLFGGSTVIVFGEPGRWTPEKDVLEHTEQGIETLVELGEPIARSH